MIYMVTCSSLFKLRVGSTKNGGLHTESKKEQRLIEEVFFQERRLLLSCIRGFWSTSKSRKVFRRGLVDSGVVRRRGLEETMSFRDGYF